MPPCNKKNCRETTLDDLKWTKEGLLLNPDNYTFWNIRKRVWKNIYLASASALCTKELLQEELDFIVRCIKLHPKSYNVWFQRIWLLKNVPFELIDWNQEMQLIELMLNFDPRNFHCWNYRRFVVGQVESRTDFEEFNFTTLKIHQNFSNYSAWHYRSALLEKYFSPSPTLKAHLVGADEEAKDLHGKGDILGHENIESVIQKEFDLIQKAVYTEPSDQSAWMYHHWLVGKGYLLLGNCSMRDEMLAKERQIIKELSLLEPDCKWPLFALTLLSGKDEDWESSLTKLQFLDPLRKVHYQFLINKNKE